MEPFTNLTQKEQIVDLAKYVSQVEESSAFHEQVNQLVEDGKSESAVELLVKQTDALVDSEEGSAYVNSLIQLAIRCEGASKFSTLLAEQLASTANEDEEDSSTLRLKLLMTLYNRVPEKSTTRCDVFSQFVKLVGEVKRAQIIVNKLSALTTWMDQWGIDVAAKRDLLLQVTKALQHSYLKADAMKFLAKYLKTFNGASADELASAKHHAEVIMAFAMCEREDFSVFTLAKLDAVSALNSGPLYKCFQAFAAGDVEGYTAAVKGNENIFEALGYTEAAVRRRVKLMALANICAEKQRLSYAEIASELAIEESEVESWVINVIRAGLVDAKLDELEKEIVIFRVTRSQFTEEHWAGLQKTLQDWQSNITSVQSTLDKVKVQMERQIHSMPTR